MFYSCSAIHINRLVLKHHIQEIVELFAFILSSVFYILLLTFFQTRLLEKGHSTCLYRLFTQFNFSDISSMQEENQMLIQKCSCMTPNVLHFNTVENTRSKCLCVSYCCLTNISIHFMKAKLSEMQDLTVKGGEQDVKPLNYRVEILLVRFPFKLLHAHIYQCPKSYVCEEFKRLQICRVAEIY